MDFLDDSIFNNSPSDEQILIHENKTIYEALVDKFKNPYTRCIAIAVVVVIGGIAALISLTASDCGYGPAMNDWQELLDCQWKDDSLVWWYDDTDVGKAKTNSQHQKWIATGVAQFTTDFDELNAGKFCDSKCEKICTKNGVRTITGRMAAETEVYDCKDSKVKIGKFSEIMNDDRKLSTQTTKSVNFATHYNDKIKTSGIPPYGDYINYDHNPPKSCYREQRGSTTCNGGSGGEKLPTMAILAVDHKGPVWSNCTTGRSTSAGQDSARQSMRRMTDFISENQYGKAILENIDCLVQFSVILDLVSSVSDYELGFYNLVLLHELSDTISSKEKEVLFQYLDEVIGETSYDAKNYENFLNKLDKANTELIPKFC